MAKPTRKDWRALKRIGRYLKGSPRLVSKFHLQPVQESIRVYSDSDWAGCKKTGKSTSGGAIMIGGHCVRTWSSTQKTIALSSGEAELIALVKASTETIGMMNLAKEWGMVFGARIFADSSAALGVVGRMGSGKLRHIRVGMLWVQSMREDGILDYRKVNGPENPADLLTKHLCQKSLQSHCDKLQQYFVSGRAEQSLHL